MRQRWSIQRVRQVSINTQHALLTPHSWRVNLGPVAPVLTNFTANPSPDGQGYNPRCLRRDISVAASSGWTKDSDVAALIKNTTSFYDFSTKMQGDFPAGYLGVHTAGHFTVGGDPGGDLFASPGDPMFFLHHASKLTFFLCS